MLRHPCLKPGLLLLCNEVGASSRLRADPSRREVDLWRFEEEMLPIRMTALILAMNQHEFIYEPLRKSEFPTHVSSISTQIQLWLSLGDFLVPP